MTDHWEYYPCQIDDQTAFVFYDHGIADIIDELGIDSFLWLKVPCLTDNGHGLPLESEFDQLGAIDDQIESFVEEHEGHYVGRITAGGARFFHCYVNASEEAVQAFTATITSSTGYTAEYIIEEDKVKEHYWGDLYPSEEEIRLMKDMKVMDALEENGDNSETPRRIDHWVYFSSKEALENYQQWAVSEGFQVHSAGEAEESLHENSYCIQLYITERPVLEEVSETTGKLVAKAEELGGEYDGWETSIEVS